MTRVIPNCCHYTEVCTVVCSVVILWCFYCDSFLSGSKASGPYRINSAHTATLLHRESLQVMVIRSTGLGELIMAVNKTGNGDSLCQVHQTGLIKLKGFKQQMQGRFQQGAIRGSTRNERETLTRHR